MHIQVHIKKAIISINNGSVGDSLIDVFFPNGNPIPKESILWDYKQQFIDEKIAYAELVKDIQSFFNSYGGYIFFGVFEEKKDEVFVIKGCEMPSDFVTKLRSAIQSYSSSEIDFNYSSFSLAGNQVHTVYIPQRPNIKPPVFLTRNGPEKKPGQPIFNEKTTYFREHDHDSIARISSHWEFLNSSRNPEDLLAGDITLSQHVILSRIIPHNLPDKNLICPHFFGREEIIALLWAWVADELESVRLLAGYGGLGKTSIAYEFANLFFKNAPYPFEQVLWLSAKRRQFRAEKNSYIELPECWYSSPKELLEALCEGTAALTQNELEAGEESEYTLQRKLRISLREIPSLIIVDDIDSLEPKDQRKVFEFVQQIAIGGGASKFLLTTRANFAFSDSQCIEVSGLSGEAYQSFVSDRLNRFKLSSLTTSDINKLHKSSCGSPLWTDSIIRLMKNGYAFDTALKEWSGKPGEDARAAALKKELIALSASAKRILYVASILQECSRTELIEITKIGKTEFDDSITELLALFLVDAPKLIKDEPRFSVPESTAIAIKELASELVPNFKQLDSSARHFINNASKTSSQGRKQKIGRIVNQSIALLNAGNQDSALQTVNTALKVMKDQPDLLMLKGRCLRETNYSDAAIAFHAAYRNGQRKPLLFDMWYQVLNIQSQFAYAAEVATLAIENELDLSTWLPLRARANVQIALMRHGDGSVESSIDMLQKAADDFILAIKSSKSSEYQSSELKLDLFKVNDAAFFIAIKGISLESDLLAFDVIRASIEKGDYRFKNVERLIEVTKRLVAGVDLSTDTQQSKACRQRISQATQSIELARRLVELDEFSLEDPSEYKSAINMLVAS